MNLSRKVYEELSGIVRKEVATNLDQQFKKMIWKQDFIDEVGIDDSFRISVVNNRGFEILSELSQGEKICLAFAYSLTLANVAGIRFPLVVDSPMGKLNPEVQDNLSEVITSATNIKTNNEDQQLILLMTDTEYTPSVKKIFAKRNAMVYSIDFDVAVSETTITREL
jgi:DNA sulfur modification protein DndD